MSDHVPRQVDDGDEEDLELLRIAALKSLNVKKETTQYHRSPSSRSAIQTSAATTHPPHKNSTSYSTIPVKQTGGTNGGAIGHENNNLLTMAPQPYYPPSVHNLPIQQPRAIPPTIDNYSARQRLEQLDLNEPYVPQRVPPIPPVGQPPTIGANGGWMSEPAPLGNSSYASYIPQKVNDTLPVGVNVQLSPRSMAFVAQNNDILMRRKGENASPNYVYRSPSPAYRISSPGRWSKSPTPPKANSRSPGHRGRAHHYSSHRRSMSRSPPPSRPRSPPPRRRSITRSPLSHQAQHPSRHQSPNPFHRFPSRSPPTHIRRAKSRSPPPHNTKHKVSPPRRRISRSPQPLNGRPCSRSPPPMNGRRSPGPLPRHANRGRRSLSPLHGRKRTSPGNHNLADAPPRHHLNRDRRSPLHLNIHRRSTSPHPLPPRPRSASRSPHRRYGDRNRKSRERNVNVNQPPRRRSPYTNNRRRYEASGPNGFRSNPRGRKRSASPTIKDRPIRRSRTRSPDRNRRQKRPRRIEHEDRRGVSEYDRNDSRRNDERISKQTQSQQSTRRDREEDVELKQKDMSQNAAPSELVSPPADKAVKVVEMPVSKESPEPESKPLEPSSAPMEIEKEASSEDEDDDDGIDLFASEESESENEGRFKSSTSKNERTTQAPTLSFTKLGESRPVEVKELTDIDPSSNRDRDRDRDRRNNYGRSRGMGGDHFRGTERISRDRDRRNKNDLGSNNKSRRDRDRERGRDRDWDSPLGKITEEKKSSGGADRPMFKSTFQALENEGRSSRRGSRERDLTDRRNLSSSRRRNTSKDKRMSPDIDADHLPSHNHPSSVITSTTNSSSCPSSPSSRGVSESGGISGKKPIHLRLGAKTNTFKPAKKTSTSPWNSSSSNGNTEKV